MNSRENIIISIMIELLDIKEHLRYTFADKI